MPRKRRDARGLREEKPVLVVVGVSEDAVVEVVEVVATEVIGGEGVVDL